MGFEPWEIDLRATSAEHLLDRGIDAPTGLLRRMLTATERTERPSPADLFTAMRPEPPGVLARVNGSGGGGGGPNVGGWVTVSTPLRACAPSGRRPHVITFGFGDASEHVLQQVSTKAGYIAETALGDSEVLNKVIVTLLNTLINSSTSGELRIPTQMDGFRSIPVKFVD